MRLRTTWLITLAVCAISCGEPADVDSAKVVALDSEPATSTIPDPAPNPTPATSTIPDPSPNPTVVNLETGLPRSSSYAIIDVEIDEVSLGDIAPNTFLRDRDVVTDGTHIFLHLRIYNRSTTDIANWPASLHLLVGDSIMPAPVVLEGRPNIGLPALQSTEMWLAFEVPGDTVFEDAALVVAQEGRIPMLLPLTGPVPHIEFPIDLDLAADGPAQGRATGCRQSLDVSLLGGSASVDLLDSDFPTGYGARRALAGDRFLSVELRVLNHGGSPCGAGGTNFGNHDIRLLVDGVAREPITWVNAAIRLEATEDFTFDFAYPVSASTLTLTVGSEDATLFSTPIDVPDLPPIEGEWLLVEER